MVLISAPNVYARGQYQDHEVVGTCEYCGNPLYLYVINDYPTCTSGGECMAVCEYCRDSGLGNPPEHMVSLGSLGHDFNSLVSSTPATCTAGGNNTYSCSRCSTTTTSTTSALGHNYVSYVTQPATCTVSGIRTYSCTRGDSSYTETIAATGHNYISAVTKTATCTDNGEEKFTCTNCGDSYDKVIDALGHDWGEEEEKEATCTEDGYKRKTCNRCEEVDETIFLATGHEFGDPVVIKASTCTEDGIQEGTCKTCGETLQTAIPSTGHFYPDEWTTEKEPTYFAEGLKVKVCKNCGDRIEESIPKKDIVPIVVGGGGVLVITGGILYYVLRRKRLAELAEKAAKELFKPSLETKSVLIVSDDEKLVDSLKGKTFLSVTQCEYDELKDSILENEPDLVLVDPCDTERLEEVSAKGEDEEIVSYPFGLIVEEETAKTNAEKLEKLKEEKSIIGYVVSGTSPEAVLTGLVLPVLNPKANSDETLENIGSIADLLGIPAVSAVLSAYTAGRDIKSILEQEELGFSDAAAIIADIAGILGLDTVESVAGLVSDVESIKAAADTEAGARESLDGVDAAKDIVEVVTDLL